ncbi:hypothetical protein OH77DRAFT_1251788 [Trametes cingulata]|nr:hypothetical protein OH77DRAFT_1251788 [Trametes cingulata]
MDCSDQGVRQARWCDNSGAVVQGTVHGRVYAETASWRSEWGGDVQADTIHTRGMLRRGEEGGDTEATSGRIRRAHRVCRGNNDAGVWGGHRRQWRAGMSASCGCGGSVRMVESQGKRVVKMVRERGSLWSGRDGRKDGGRHGMRPLDRPFRRILGLLGVVLPFPLQAVWALGAKAVVAHGGGWQTIERPRQRPVVRTADARGQIGLSRLHTWEWGRSAAEVGRTRGRGA